jgi:tetratricopeptide (TPR) repeat protein
MITVLLAAGGLVGYFSAIGKARKEAEEAAKNWFSENDTVLRNKINELMSAAEKGHSAIHASIEEVNARKNAAIEKIQRNIGDQASADSHAENAVDTKALQQRSEELRSIPEANYSFDDWKTRAFAAYNNNQFEEAALFWDYASKTPAAGAVNSAQSIYNRGVALGQLGRHDQAILAYDQLISLYGQDSAPALREQVARAMSNRCIALGQHGRHDQAIAACDQMISLYGQDSTPALREQVARAMSNRGVALGQLERHDQAIAAYDQVVTFYGQDSTPALREQVARAMSNRCIALGQLGHHDQAITAYDQMIALYNQEAIPTVRELIAKGMNNRSILLGRRGRYNEAIAACDQVIALYSQDSVPLLVEQVTEAMNGKGFALLCQAKSRWDQKETTKALLGDAAQILREAQERKTLSGMILGNQAYVAWLQEAKQQATQLFNSALAAPEYGGEELYKATLSDFEIHPVPEDQGFRELVERLWAGFQANQNKGHLTTDVI